MDSDLKRRRVITIAAVAIVAGVIALVAYGNIGGNLVYYWSPKEIHDAGNKAVGASIRLGGLVAPGSIERATDRARLALHGHRRRRHGSGACQRGATRDVP